MLSFYNNPDLADGFGATKGRVRPHRGLDFAKKEGTAIPALYSGKIVRRGWSNELGNVVVVEHGKGVFMGYCHLQKPGLAVGTSVISGTTIGYTGNTGTATTGPHVHVTKGSTADAVYGASMSVLSDPWPYIKEAVEWSKKRPSTPQAVTKWAFNKPSQSVQKRIQQALKNRKRYSGPVDGAWGVNSIKGIQQTIRNVGYTGAIDGVPGSSTCYYVQVYAQKFGGYKGPIDRVLGPNSWAGFALGLERP